MQDIPAELVSELWGDFEGALLLLESAGKVYGSLSVSPWSYVQQEQRDYILSCRERLPQYRIAIEFSHNSGGTEKNEVPTLSFLRDKELPLVCLLKWPYQEVGKPLSYDFKTMTPLPHYGASFTISALYISGIASIR